MKANELRIGNLLYMKGYHDVIITAEYIVSISHGDDRFEPIQITEEWLLKLGFKDSNSSSSKMKFIRENDKNGNSNIILYLSNLGIPSISSKCTGFSFIPVDCAYVHQLQNLYFALTGEELCLK